MELKKVALRVALMTSLVGAGCSGEDTTTGGESSAITGPEFATPECTGGAGPEEAVTYRVTQLVVPTKEAALVPGFDFDGVDTNACGANSDFPSGVDNGIAYLTEDLALIETVTQRSIQQSIDTQIAAETLVIEFTVVGYDGSGNDGCVEVSLNSNWGDDASGDGVVMDGVLYAKFDGKFGLGLPVWAAEAGLEGSRDINANLDVFAGAGTFHIDAAVKTGVFGGVVNRGGTLDYCTSASDTCVEPAGEAPLGSAHRGVYDAIDELDPELHAAAGAVIDPIMDMAFDIISPAGGPECGGLTAALDFTAVEVVP